MIEAAGGGFDTVYARSTFVLNADAQVESSRSPPNPIPCGQINLTGNDFGQSIIGNAAANILDGRGGTTCWTAALATTSFTAAPARTA